MSKTSRGEFTRSRETYPVTLPNGFKTKIAFQLKCGIAQVFWYYIQLPCRRWREFDIRYAALIDQGDSRMWNTPYAKKLETVAEILQDESHEEFYVGIVGPHWKRLRDLGKSLQEGGDG